MFRTTFHNCKWEYKIFKGDPHNTSKDIHITTELAYVSWKKYKQTFVFWKMYKQSTKVHEHQTPQQ